MNPRLSALQAYPFERLRQLLAGVTPSPGQAPISLGIGEPKHATPALILDAIANNLQGLASYPATQGEAALRQALVAWVKRRYGVSLDVQRHVLPVSGSREALFAVAQTVIDPSDRDAVVLCPNPFYQIYEGATLLAGATPWYVPSDPERNFGLNWDAVPHDVWARTRMVYVCTPGNPAGAVMGLDEWKSLFALSDQHGFVIVSDECYSEIYFRNEPPLGSLQAAVALGREEFPRLLAITSLSKRSNVPGMRSGFCAGDADLIRAFLLYRTYHGCALGPVVQAASRVAWSDEAHVQANRVLYREKFSRLTPMLAEVLDVRLPDAGFYLWAAVKGSDTEFARDLFAQYNVTVLPGSFLAREAGGHNPGAGRIRLALVADLAECEEAVRRIVEFAGLRGH